MNIIHPYSIIFVIWDFPRVVLFIDINSFDVLILAQRAMGHEAYINNHFEVSIWIFLVTKDNQNKFWLVWNFRRYELFTLCDAKWSQVNQLFCFVVTAQNRWWHILPLFSRFRMGIWSSRKITGFWKLPHGFCLKNHWLWMIQLFLFTQQLLLFIPGELFRSLFYHSSWELQKSDLKLFCKFQKWISAVVVTLVSSTPICLFFNLAKLQCKQTVVTDFCIGFVNKIRIIGKGIIKETWIAKVKEIGCWTEELITFHPFLPVSAWS